MQTLIDIAVQEYGTQEAVPILIADNPQLFEGDVEFDISSTSINAADLVIRDEDEIKDKKVLKELDEKIIVSE